MSSKQENTVSQWAFKNNSVLITAENWCLKGQMLHIKVHAVPLQHFFLCFADRASQYIYLSN